MVGLIAIGLISSYLAPAAEYNDRPNQRRLLSMEIPRTVWFPVFRLEAQRLDVALSNQSNQIE